MDILFKKTKMLEKKVDNFLDLISQGVMVFEMAMTAYVEDNMASFQEKYKRIDSMEHQADELRKDIEVRLYTEALIPDFRGDVLAILENMDNIIDTAKKTITSVDIEKPTIIPAIKKDLLELLRVSKEAAESLVCATRAFFRNIEAVKDHVHKVKFFEGEADVIADRIKRTIFAQEDLRLSHKNHLRFFISFIERVSDHAEAVAERLNIYTIKRSI